MLERQEDFVLKLTPDAARQRWQPEGRLASGSDEENLSHASRYAVQTEVLFVDTLARNELG